MPEKYKQVRYTYETGSIGRFNEYAKEVKADFVDGKQMDTTIEFRPALVYVAGKDVQNFLDDLAALVAKYSI